MEWERVAFGELFHFNLVLWQRAERRVDIVLSTAFLGLAQNEFITTLQTVLSLSRFPLFLYSSLEQTTMKRQRMEKNIIVRLK